MDKIKYYKNIFINHLKLLSIPGNRFKNIKGIQYRENYIKNTLFNAKIPFKIQSFNAWGVEGYNIIASVNCLNGKISKLLIIGAHYDTVPYSPGANDNTTSVACLLTLMEEIVQNKTKLNIPLDICFWDMEEAGKKGSAFYVQQLKKTSNIKYISIVLDLLGWYNNSTFSQKIPVAMLLKYPKVFLFNLSKLNKADFHLVIGKKNDIDTILKNVQHSNDIQLLFAPDNLTISEKIGLCDSDHHNFWLVGIPSILITDTGKFRNLAYHTSEDTYEKINVDFVLNIFNLLKKIVLSI